MRMIESHFPVLSKVINIMNQHDMFNDIVVLHINHFLDDVFILDGIFNNLFFKSVFIAVPYRNAAVPSHYPGTLYHAAFHENGFELFCSEQRLVERVETFSDAMESMIAHALRHVIAPALTGSRKLLVIEDGGYHYEPLRRCCAEGLVDPEAIVGVVEQTMSGAIRCADAIRKYGLAYPAFTIARSDMKMRYEAFFLGRRVVDELAYLLYLYDEFLALRRVLIIGYGIIGRSMALSLNGMACQITVLDSNDDIATVARADGHEVLPSHEDLRNFFDTEVVVIGSTGEASFTLSMLVAFAHGPAPQVFLVSASSKRTEFDAIIQFFEGGTQNRARLLASEPRLAAIHDIDIETNPSGLTYTFKYGDRVKRIVLIARGFPVNFFRKDGFSLTMGMIDPVNAELALLAGYAVTARQALQKNRLYALGYSPLPGLSLSEEEILSIWMEKRGITSCRNSPTAWHGFPVHPLEGYLRLRRLSDVQILARETECP
ncbi:MAG: adenosylhomocysteinase [Rhodospirillaceae bacterium]|nr:MAG: adenosylhomocysteinase [Rhodospirillaceae bacterium]